MNKLILKIQNIIFKLVVPYYEIEAIMCILFGLMKIWIGLNVS